MSRSRRRRLERRTRPRKANARYRKTTLAGRRGEPVIDHGTVELRDRKRRLTRREDLELTGAAVLFAHEHLDRQQFDTLGVVTDWLRRIARAWGGRGGSCEVLWQAITPHWFR
jgi:hypothetical protein